MKVKQEDESQLVKRQPSRKRKSVIVQAKFIPRDGMPMPWSKNWFTYGKYIDLKTAHDVIAKMSDRKKYMEYRIKGETCAYCEKQRSGCKCGTRGFTSDLLQEGT